MKRLGFWALVLGVAIVGAAPARAQHSMAARADLLVPYGGVEIALVQPEPDDDAGEEDSLGTGRDLPGSEGTTQQQQQKSFTPNFGSSVPDTGKSRPDSTAQFLQNSAPILPPPVQTGSSSSPIKSRRGILGIHPAALLVGLIALHIFVVSVAAK